MITRILYVVKFFFIFFSININVNKLVLKIIDIYKKFYYTNSIKINKRLFIYCDRGEKMIYGYCRVSTNKQVITRQVENILKIFPEAKIYQEIFTGTKTEERKVYQNLKKKLNNGDTLVFDSVSRMSRNAEEGVQEYFEFYNQGINLIFLKERYIDTDVYKKAKNQQLKKTGNKITDILLSAIEEVLKIIAEEQIHKAFEQSEKEVLDNRIRTKEGLKVKKAQGVVLGRRLGVKIETKKSIEMKEKIKLLSKDFAGTLKDIQVIEILKISRNTYFKYKREIKEKL